MDTGSNYYARLGLTKDATPEELRQAYHAAALRFHPDVNQEPEAVELFLAIQEAYEVLSDLKKRATYNKTYTYEEETPPIASNVIYSRSTLIQLDEPQLVYILLDIVPTLGLDDKTDTSLNVCLVIDRSTSMHGARIDTVKRTAVELIHQLKPRDILSIVTFSDHADVLLPAGIKLKRENIESRIRMIRIGGGTEIYRGLEAGFREVCRYLRPSSINHLVLLTDGRTYGDETDCQNLANKAAALGVGISGLGIGNKWNDSFLDNLAARTGSSSTYISNPANIKQFLKQKIRSLSQVYAEGVTFDVKTGTGVELKYAFRLEPEASALETTLPLRMGNIPRDSSLKVVLEMQVPPIPKDTKRFSLAEGSFRFSIPSQEIPTCNMRVSLSLPISKSTNLEPPPPDILKAIERITLYRMQERARQEVRNGDLANASRRLQYLANHLLSKGKRKLAQTVLVEAENLQHSHTFSEEGGKQIKYGTRSLILPGNTDNILP